jgi:hypothetical protein
MPFNYSLCLLDLRNHLIEQTIGYLIRLIKTFIVNLRSASPNIRNRKRPGTTGKCNIKRQVTRSNPLYNSQGVCKFNPGWADWCVNAHRTFYTRRCDEADVFVMYLSVIY